MATPTKTPARRGRPAAADRDDVIAAATRAFCEGQRVDIQAIAAELGLGRTTIYRWFGTREGLIGEVVARAPDPLLDEARATATGKGAEGLLDTFDRFNHSIAQAGALRSFVDRERGAALRMIMLSGGAVERHMVTRIAALIQEEVASGSYRPPVDPQTLAYAIVRLAVAFLFNEAGADIRADVDRLREIEALILGVDAGHRPDE